MQNSLLRSDKLTICERIVILGLSFMLWMSIFVLAALFLVAPWTVGGIAAIAAWFHVQARRRGLASQTSGVHGRAHFGTEDEVAAAGFSGRSDGIILGKLAFRVRGALELLLTIPHVRMREATRLRDLLGELLIRRNARYRSGVQNLVRLPTSDAFSHLSCYFHSGAGKTFKLLVPNLYCCGENAVVFDPSAETVRQTAEFRRRVFGHDIVVIDPFGESGWRDCGRFNPLSLVRPGDPRCFDFATHMAHALVVEKPESRQDPFWHSGTLLAVTFLLMAVILRGGKHHANLLTLGELISAERFRELCESLMDHPDPGLRRRAQQLLSFKGKTLDSLLACLAATLGWMDSPALGDVLSDSTFSVEDLFQPNRKVTVYVVIPGHRAVESQPYLRLILTAMLFAGFDAGPDIHRPPVRFYLDEAATLGKLDILLSLYTQGRKFGMRSFTFFQSVGQVAEIVGSPDRIATFRGQMACELFKANDLPTAKEISDWCGPKTVQTKSTSLQDGTNGGWSNSQGNHSSQGRSGGWSESASATISETGVPLIRPDEVLQLGKNEAICLIAGNPPIRLNILDAADVQECANPEAHNGYQKKYRLAIRARAFVFLLLVPVSFIVVARLVETGWAEWTRRHSPAVHRMPAQAGQPRRLPAGRGGW
jgi:type IV secretion system protein VirD4